jgi:predicted nucleotidyltransferase
LARRPISGIDDPVGDDVGEADEAGEDDDVDMPAMLRPATGPTPAALGRILPGMSPATEIREARRRAGLTQARLARRSRTSQAAISEYESGRRVPEPATLRRILRAARPLPSTVLDRRRAAVLDVARRFGVTQVRVFGSVATGDDGPDSDIDLLVRLPEEMDPVDFVRFCEALEEVLEVHVDVVSEAALGEDATETVARALAL